MKGSTKAVLVLVVIALCSALLLSVLSDVLYVSDDDKDNMKLKSVHASAVTERITNVSENTEKPPKTKNTVRLRAYTGAKTARS